MAIAHEEEMPMPWQCRVENDRKIIIIILPWMGRWGHMAVAFLSMLRL